MATASGRGRGRGRGLLCKDPVSSPVPRPGSAGDASSKPVENGSSSKKIIGRSGRESVSEIHDLLKNLTLDVSEHDYEQLEELAKDAVHNDTDVKKLAEIVYSKCISDREFAKAGACICDKLAMVEADGTKFRSSLLGLLQVDFKNKEEIRSRSQSKFLNVFSFMCQMFGTMRTATGEVFKPLVSPLYDYIHAIMDSQQSNDDDFECLSLQLLTIGRELEQSDKEKMTLLMEKVRTRLIREGTTGQTRCTLLEVFESYCRGWKDLHNDITRFYCDTMADILSGLVE